MGVTGSAEMGSPLGILNGMRVVCDQPSPLGSCARGGPACLEAPTVVMFALTALPSSVDDEAHFPMISPKLQE